MRRAFTLVEMLVVLGIIGVLAALLLPSVMAAVNRSRVAGMALEVSQLSDALEAYKQDKGDYPPNFRDVSVFLAHVRKCYPKCSQSDIDLVVDFTTNPPTFKPDAQLDEGECLVFWLSLTSTDPRLPFSGAAKKVYYEFDTARLFDSTDNDEIPAFRPKYAGESCYVYIDRRSFDPMTEVSGGAFVNAGATAEDSSNATRPYMNGPPPPTLPMMPPPRHPKMADTKFQLICAGQDGLFGIHPGPAQYPDGENYTDEDKDNITNFSEGGRLIDRVP